MPSRYLAALMVGLAVGAFVGIGSAPYLGHAPTEPPSIESWPPAARTIIALKDKQGEAQGLTIVGHHTAPVIRTDAGGTVWTTVEEAKDPNGRNIFVPFSIELNEQSELVDVN